MLALSESFTVTISVNSPSSQLQVIYSLKTLDFRFSSHVARAVTITVCFTSHRNLRFELRYLFAIVAASLVFASVAACGVGLCNCATLAMVLFAAGLHCYQFWTTLKGLEKWREPSLQCGELHAVSSKLLPHSEEQPETLTTPRRSKLIFVRFFLSVVAIVGAVTLGLVALDGCQVRGELVDNSWS